MVTAAQVEDEGAWFGNVPVTVQGKHFNAHSCSISLVLFLSPCFLLCFSISFHIRNVFCILKMSTFQVGREMEYETSRVKPKNIVGIIEKQLTEKGYTQQ